MRSQLGVGGLTEPVTPIDAKLYMINLNAPRLYYYERSKPAFDAIVESARLS